MSYASRHRMASLIPSIDDLQCYKNRGWRFILPWSNMCLNCWHRGMILYFLALELSPCAIASWWWCWVIYACRRFIHFCSYGCHRFWPDAHAALKMSIRNNELKSLPTGCLLMWKERLYCMHDNARSSTNICAASLAMPFTATAAHILLQNLFLCQPVILGFRD